MDTFLQSAAFGLGNGMSGHYWNNQHNKHHATPQKLQHDVDLHTLPLVAFDQRIAKMADDGFTRYWLLLQHFLFFSHFYNASCSWMGCLFTPEIYVASKTIQ